MEYIDNNFTQGTARQRYSKLKQHREHFLDRAEECSEITIPSLIQPDGFTTSSDLYNRTYFKVVAKPTVTNTVATGDANNNIEVLESTGVYTDIKVTCTLDFGEPSGQDASDDATTDTDYVFDELGLYAYYQNTATTSLEIQNALLLSHVIFHPVQKSTNRQIEIVYTIRVQMQ